VSDERFSELIAERVVIRRFRRTDVESFAAYRSDPAVARFQGWDAPYTLDQAERFVGEMEASHPDTPGSWFQFAVVSRADDTLVGDCGASVSLTEPRQVEVGFTIASAYQRHGYGTEAVRRLLDYWFIDRGKHRVVASCDARNVASMHLLQRIGFRREGHLVQSTYANGEWTDDLLFALLTQEWARGPTDSD
jgi:RimJ/RimL family protein N-acetyltransferase